MRHCWLDGDIAVRIDWMSRGVVDGENVGIGVNLVIVRIGFVEFDLSTRTIPAYC